VRSSICWLYAGSRQYYHTCLTRYAKTLTSSSTTSLSPLATLITTDVRGSAIVSSALEITDMRRNVKNDGSGYMVSSSAHMGNEGRRRMAYSTLTCHSRKLHEHTERADISPLWDEAPPVNKLKVTRWPRRRQPLERR